MKNLNHHDIHEIISQISQSLTCPECSARILPHNIRITDIVNDECYFDVDCHRCEAEMTLSAHVEKTPNEAAMTYNQSSQILHDSYATESIDVTDVQAIRDELKHFCGSFIETFANY